MISLFAKRDTGSQARDSYGRWTVGQGNANAAKSYAHWKVHERATAERLAGDARRFAGKRGEKLRRNVFEGNAREFAGRGLDKVTSQAKRLNALLQIHGANMGLIAPEEQTLARASMFAHGLQHNEGPLGRLTPSYRDMLRAKVKAALAAEGEKMKTAMTARKPRAKKVTEAAKAAVKKFNQEHGEHGMFTGPGGSHDPTGNPRGRPAGAAGPTTGQRVGQAALDIGASAAGGYAGSALFGAAGAAIGGPPGALIGGTAGKWAGSILGSLAGDYVASKIGQGLLGIKEQADGHALGTGEIVGSIAGAVAPIAASAVIPGGGAVSQLFSPTNFSLASHVAEEAAGGVGGAIGHAVDQRASTSAGKGVSKGMFDKPPKSYDGSFGSMSAASLPHLFGPRAWKGIADTPFGAYVRQKVKDAASKMDDAAEAQGLDLKPAKPAQVQTASTVMQQAEAERQQQEQQAMMAQQAPPPGQGRAPGGSPGAGMQKSLFRKAFTLPMRSPNDVVSSEAHQSGGQANVRFLRQMQEIENRKRSATLNRLSGPRVENLARKPNEDERGYKDRVQALMRDAVHHADQLRPKLFTGGGAGQRTVYSVRKVAPAVSAVNDDEQSWRIEAEFAKGYNTEDTLKQGLVYGWASIIEKNGEVVTDHQGDRVTSDELLKAAHDYVSNSRQGGVLHDEYGHEIGRIVESLVFTKQLQDHLGIDLGKVGWLIGYKIEDPRVKTLVKAGVLKSFSIGGRGRREPADADAA